MANWSSFQSVIQLAIALNCAFATLAPFLGSASERDRHLAETYLQQLDHYETSIAALPASEKAIAVGGQIAGMQSALSDVMQASSVADERITSFLNGSIRMFCLIFAAISLGALFISSYADAKDSIGEFWHVYMYAQYFPFVLGVGRAMWLARQHLANRQAISDAVVHIQKIEALMRDLRTVDAKAGV